MRDKVYVKRKSAHLLPRRVLVGTGIRKRKASANREHRHGSIAQEERAGARLLAADITQHLQTLELHELVRRERHPVAIGVVSRSARLLSLLPTILGKLALCLGLDPLLLRSSLDSLRRHGGRRVRLASGHTEQDDGQLGGFDVGLECLLDLTIDLLDRVGQHIVMLVSLDRIASLACPLDPKVVVVPGGLFADHLTAAEVLDQAVAVDDLDPDGAVEVQRNRVAGHEVVELDLELLGLHVHITTGRGECDPLPTRRHGVRIHPAGAEEPGLADDDSLVTGIGCDAMASDEGQTQQQDESDVLVEKVHYDSPMVEHSEEIPELRYYYSSYIK